MIDEKSKSPFNEGDIVRVKDPSIFVDSFAKKIANRDAVVLWVGPLDGNMFNKKAKVRFMRRNGRGKEFEEILLVDYLMIHHKESQ